MMTLTPHRQNVLVLWRNGLVMLALGLLAAACGGSSTPPVTSTAGGTPGAECDPDNSTPGTGDDCGDVYIGLTDADGDFLSYTVDVTEINLLRADGTAVRALPASARVDFAQYTEMTEFITAASVPPGTYVSGIISLDYSDAEIVVEKGDQMVNAVVLGADGQPLVAREMELVLDNRQQLVVRPGIPSLLTIDFDLGASHELALDASPVTATAQPFLLAEVDPVSSKELRLRGPLLALDPDTDSYVINIRPFHLRDGMFGRARIHTSGATAFEVDGVTYEGAAGLAAMADLARGAPTVAFGELNVLDREFTADRVYAGSSVSGSEIDAVHGNVISREGNSLKVQGAILVPRQGRAGFRRSVTVLVGDGTVVLKDGSDEVLDISAISVGQRISAFGALGAESDAGIEMDATEGRVRLLRTRLSGTVNRVLPGQLDLTLQGISGRPARLFDFTGTGISPEVDANPDDYEVGTATLNLFDSLPGAPVSLSGFVTAFGEAPPDFQAESVADFSDARAMLTIGWGVEGTATPFASLTTDGIALDLDNEEIGARHYIRQGAVFIDLLNLTESPLIVPNPDVPGVFAIQQDHMVWMHSDFAMFIEDLTGRLDGNARVSGLHASGGFRPGDNVFNATRIGVFLN